MQLLPDMLGGRGVVTIALTTGLPGAEGLDRGGQGGEDPVLADPLQEAGGRELCSQVLLDPGQGDHDAAVLELLTQGLEDVHRGDVDLDDRLGVEDEPLAPCPLVRSTAARARLRKSSALAKKSGESYR